MRPPRRDAAHGDATTYLFVPADRPERLPKAMAAGAGAVIVDLEDAVDPAHKAAARAALHQGLLSAPNANANANDSASACAVWVRVNAVDTPWFAEDLDLLRTHTKTLAGLMLPKAESARDVDALQALDLPVIALVESARGLLGLAALAAHADVVRLAFGSADLARLAALGTSCPDHFLRTKIAPLVLDPARLTDDAYLAEQITAYRAMYAAYYERCKRPNSPAMRDANPVVVLVPGVGRITFATDKTTARLAGEFYGNAINVMRGAEAIGDYIALDSQEAFDIEYWLLEEAKLQRMPAPKPMVGKIALVTGGAGGIGAATAARLLAEGACVMLADRDGDAVEAVRAGFAKQFGQDVVRAATCDVTDEAQVQAAFAACAREFGGLDILVANAGIASSAGIEDTTIALWDRNYDVLAKGYFLTARAAWPLLKAMKDQGGTSVVFIGSKNAVAAAAGASAYASAKAAANHLARCLALEGAPDGIRVNVVNPDAVIKGSRIWDGDWRKERAGTHGIDSGKELEEHYRQRSMLKRDVLPEDIAEAACWLASELSSKSTGNMINVDAGNAQAFTR